MSSKKIIRPTFLMLALAFASIAWGAAMPRSINNDKDLKSALKAARTPQDHERIAAYCRSKAERLDAEAAEYERAAKSYREGPAVKNIAPPNTAARYEEMAKEFRRQADSCRELAASQERFLVHAP